MPHLGARHHALIQSLLARGPLAEKDFHALFVGVTGQDPVTNRQALSDFLLMINKELAYVQMELRGCRNQYDGRVYYGVVNNVVDEQSKLGTRYSVPQIAFYKAVARKLYLLTEMVVEKHLGKVLYAFREEVEAIIQDVTNQGFITNIDALNIRLENQVQTGQSSQDNQSNIPPAFKNFSISQKEKTLRDLIQDRWLCHITDGKVGLGVRSFLDLRSWFRNNDVPPCDVCNEAGVKASTCPKEGCTIRMHAYCSKKKFSRQKAGRVCPSCNTAWPQEESDFEEGNEENSSHPRQDLSNDPPRRIRNGAAEAETSQAQTESPLGLVPRKRPRRCKTENVDATEAGPSQSTTSSPDRPITRRSQRLKIHITVS